MDERLVMNILDPGKLKRRGRQKEEKGEQQMGKVDNHVAGRRDKEGARREQE